MEVVMAVMILAFVSASVLTVMNQCIGAATDSRTRTQAFEIARENLESLLSEDKLPEKTEFGFSEINPDIQWETVIETFTEPVTNSMWLQAVCSASYTDKDGQIQSVELTHWLSEIPEAMRKKIEEQNELEQQMMIEYAEATGLNLNDLEIGENGQPQEKDPVTDPEEEYDELTRTYDPSRPTSLDNYPLDWGFNELFQWLLEQRDK